LEWDYRNSPTYPTKGGIWRLEAHYFRDTNEQDFRFMRYRVESAHYLPIGDEHGFAVRTLAIFNDNQGKSTVPFFEQAILGGGNTMRGFREFRFYDDNALLFNVEYRWQIWRFADAVLFVDEGQVANDPKDFSLEGFRNSHGIGLRFKSKRGQLFRVDVGHSSEGWRVYFTFSPTF
jgi:outer membrane protein assembly factor BamA